jgi:hypothetical protein
MNPYICIACQIGTHNMCRTGPECDCDCVEMETLKNREFTDAQLAIIEESEREDSHE